MALQNSYDKTYNVTATVCDNGWVEVHETFLHQCFTAININLVSIANSVYDIGMWVWKGPLVDSPMLVTDWAAKEPNNGNVPEGAARSQDCVHIYGDRQDLNSVTQRFRWDDDDCGRGYPFICEKRWQK